MNRKSEKIIEIFNTKEGLLNIYSIENVKSL